MDAYVRRTAPGHSPCCSTRPFAFVSPGRRRSDASLEYAQRLVLTAETYGGWCDETLEVLACLCSRAPRRPGGRARVRVFVSYRRNDVGGYAGRLHDGLVQRLGASSVFHDVSVIAPGTDFVELIDLELDRSDAVLVVIGPGWATAATAEGDVRLQQPDDFVRKEVAGAATRPSSRAGAGRWCGATGSGRPSRRHARVGATPGCGATRRDLAGGRRRASTIPSP